MKHRPDRGRAQRAVRPAVLGDGHGVGMHQGTHKVRGLVAQADIQHLWIQKLVDTALLRRTHAMQDKCRYALVRGVVIPIRVPVHCTRRIGNVPALCRLVGHPKRYDPGSVRLPLDEKGADILLITPSADFFAEPHIDGFLGYAKVFHEAGVSWTVSSYASEAANFGLFIGSYEQMREISIRIRDAARDLGVKRIVFGECGHAWRVGYSFLNTLAAPFDFLDQSYPVPQHIM